MAGKKESIVFIVDVGAGAEALTKKASDCIVDLIQHKIYFHKDDLLSFLLLRTENTNNEVNDEAPEQYLHISRVFPCAQVPTWMMIKEFQRSLVQEKSSEGDWIDALVVALGILAHDSQIHRTSLLKIVLFHDFDSCSSNLDEAILHKINDMGVKLIFISQCFVFVREPEGCFYPKLMKSTKNHHQEKNEETIMNMAHFISQLRRSNFSDAKSQILCKDITKPWIWNTVLSIGSQIKIYLSGIIHIKMPDKVPKFVMRSSDPNKMISRTKRYFCDETELEDDGTENFVSGFMLGGTAVPCDPSLGQDTRHTTTKGVHFIGFILKSNITDEYYSGQSTYVLVPQRGKLVSVAMTDSLVRSMMAAGMAILAWKVFNNGFKPRLVVLYPTLEFNNPGFLMIELSYHIQHQFWEFPKLTSVKKQPTAEQFSAIDDFMAAMNLSNDDEEITQRDTLRKEKFPFDSLPNVRHQHIINFLGKSIIGSDLETVDYMKIPEDLELAAADAATKVKEVFSLKPVVLQPKERLKQQFEDVREAQGESSTAPTEPVEGFKLVQVGTVTPASDFTQLITNVVNKMQDGAERAAKFHQFCCQMRTVISDLLFKTMTKQFKKVEEALITYRNIVMEKNSLHDYNEWIRDIRAKVIERKLTDFWEDTIVKHKLGPCMEDNKETEHEFYNIAREVNANLLVNALMGDDESLDDLFNNM